MPLQRLGRILKRWLQTVWYLPPVKLLTPAGEMVGGDVSAQCVQVIANLKAVLEAAGSSFDKVIKTTIFLADMDDFAAVNAIYGEAFGEHKPARSTVAVKTLPKNALVEIDAIALI